MRLRQYLRTWSEKEMHNRPPQQYEMIVQDFDKVDVDVMSLLYDYIPWNPDGFPEQPWKQLGGIVDDLLLECRVS